MDNDLLSPLSIEPQSILYRDRNHVVQKIVARFPDFSKEYFVSRFGERIGVVLLRAGAVLLVRQYRLFLNALSWEIPGGGLDHKESPKAGARRECREEAGIVCRGLIPLVTYHPGLDTLWNPTHLFCCRDFEERPHAPRRGEVTERAWVPLASAMDMIRRGEILDSMSLVALLAVGARLHEPLTEGARATREASD